MLSRLFQVNHGQQYEQFALLSSSFVSMLSF